MDFEEYYTKTLPDKYRKRQSVVRERAIEVVKKAITYILAQIRIEPPNWHRRIEIEGKNEICWEVAYDASDDCNHVYYYLLPDGRIFKVGDGVRCLIELNGIDEKDLTRLASGILRNAEINFRIKLNPAWKEPGYLSPAIL